MGHRDGGGGCNGQWCGMLCAGFKLVTIDKQKTVQVFLSLFESLYKLRCMLAAFWI